MIRPGVVLSFARSELRLTRRLVRYWVFLALSYLVVLVAVLYYSVLHSFVSSYSATAASIGPRYLIAYLGLYYLVIFMLGIVFLGFDVRGRDRREHMDEVLDARPYTNLELVAGRWLGLLLAAWVPVAVLALLVQGLGALLPALGSPVGETVEPWSLLGFVTVMALPAFGFTIAMVQLVAVTVRHRLAAAVVAIAILAALVVATVRTPLAWSPLFDFTGAYVVEFPSDLVPRIATGAAWLHRLGTVVAMLGLLVLAAALHPRLDGGSRLRRAAVGAVVAVAGVGLMGSVTWQRLAMLDVLETWRAAHEARVADPAPDLVALTGTVDLEPGERLDLDLRLELAAPDDSVLETALLTLNPGLQVGRVSAGGRELAYRFEHGLLQVELPEPLSGDGTAFLELEAGGRPDRRFGYLDAVTVPEALVAWQGQLFILGSERMLFDRRLVALMPAAACLPRSGPDAGRDELGGRPRDFFAIDLEVRVPDGWSVAAPGVAGTAAAGGERSGYRFAPPAPVDEVAVVASRYERFATDVAGVEVEVLLHPDHAGPLETLAPARSELEAWLAERLEDAAREGLPYPYDGLTFVEVPNTLRGFGGGWRLDSVMAPPGMVLVRESGFPTARFDVAFRNPERFRDRDGGLPRAMRDRVLAFFRNDFSGGNLFTGMARSFFLHQTAPAGDGAEALGFVLQELTSLSVTGARGYFSAHLFGPEMGQTINAVVGRFFASGRDSREFAGAVLDAVTSRPEVWEQALEESLVELDPRDDPQRAIDVLALKAGALSQALYDEPGADATARLLSELRDRFRGQTFTAEELGQVAATIDPRVPGMVEERLRTTALPGFVAERASLERLRDAGDGTPRYQLRLTIRNDEPVPGLLRVVRAVGEGDESERFESEPVRIGGRSAVEYGAVLTRPASGVWVEPYLSLNREAFRVDLGELEGSETSEATPFEGVVEVAWAPPDPSVVVVDDLDDGFRIAATGERGGVRLAARAVEGEADRGLPRVEGGRPPGEWSRASSASAWGRYRHTVAWRRGGDGEIAAAFAAEIPAAGEWELELHLPDRQRFRFVREWGVWTVVVDDGRDQREAEIDAGAAARGWNPVGTFDLPAGEVVVRLSDDTESRIIVADAVRWRRAAGAEGGGAS